MDVIIPTGAMRETATLQMKGLYAKQVCLIVQQEVVLDGWIS